MYFFFEHLKYLIGSGTGTDKKLSLRNRNRKKIDRFRNTDKNTMQEHSFAKYHSTYVKIKIIFFSALNKDIRPIHIFQIMTEL